MTILMFLTGKKITITFALSQEKFLYKDWIDFFDVGVKAELRLSHI